jgi:hypothetical protein
MLKKGPLGVGSIIRSAINTRKKEWWLLMEWHWVVK